LGGDPDHMMGHDHCEDDFGNEMHMRLRDKKLARKQRMLHH